MSPNSFEYVRLVLFRTVDGWFAVVSSLSYLFLGGLIMVGLWDPPEMLGLERDLGGYMLMPAVFLLVHLWYRLGIDVEKPLHFPSMIGVSVLAVLVPLIRTGVLQSG